GDRVAPEIGWRLHAGWARVLRTQGATDAAARELRVALKEVERPSQSLALAERRSAFLADKWDVYAQLALVEHDRTHPGAAFDASERLRAREMLELLRRGRVTPPADTAVDLVTREQDLRRRIAELSDEVGGGPISDEAMRGPDPTRGAGTSRETLLHTQEAYTELLLEMRERAPRHVALVAPEVASWQSVARRLSTDQAFVEYLVSDSGSLAFVITADTIASIDLGSRRGDLVRLIEFARGTIMQRHTGVDSLWCAPLRQLHQRLIEPIEAAGLLSHTTRLVLVPHAELNYLPFAALIDGTNHFLVERYELATTPS